MTFNHTFKQIGAQANDESVGKVFVVMSVDTRKCLVCDQVFTRQGSFHHSMVTCYPNTESDEKTTA
jgi:hypothetical protein